MVEISNPDKVLFPDAGLTKADVVGYYVEMADRILPHLAERPVTIHRFPNGIGASGFMQKNVQDYFPEYIGRIEVPKRDGGVTNFPLISNVDGLAYLANLGAITFHVPTSRIGAFEAPDRFIIDLDPDAGEVEAVKGAARVVGESLSGMGLTTTPMTTGSKGYHLVARLDGSVPIEQVSQAAYGFAWLTAEEHPDALTIEFRKKNRKGRVFIDWMRNSAMATGVAAWSLRSRPGAPVATPITWDDLDDSEPARWRIDDLADRTDVPDPILELAEQTLRPFADAVSSTLDERGIELPVFDRFRS